MTRAPYCQKLGCQCADGCPEGRYLLPDPEATLPAGMTIDQQMDDPRHGQADDINSGRF